jgi:hypothetical protein
MTQPHKARRAGGTAGLGEVLLFCRRDSSLNEPLSQRIQAQKRDLRRQRRHRLGLGAFASRASHDGPRQTLPYGRWIDRDGTAWLFNRSSECGEICGGKGKRQIQIWHQEGIFAPVLYFGKSPRVRRVDLAAWIAAGGTKPHAKPARSRKRRA